MQQVQVNSSFSMMLLIQVNVLGSLNQSLVERQRLLCSQPTRIFPKTDVCVLAVHVLLQCCCFAGYVANVPIIEPWGCICVCPWMALSQDPGAPEIQSHPFTDLQQLWLPCVPTFHGTGMIQQHLPTAGAEQQGLVFTEMGFVNWGII